MVRDGIHLQLIPAPSTGDGRPAAGTVQSPFLRGADNLRYQVSSVSVRTEANQISGTALRTLDAVTNATRHSTIDRAETSRFSAIPAALESSCTNIPVAPERFLETVDRSVVCTSDTLTVGRHEQFVRNQMMNVEQQADSTIARGGYCGWTFADPAPKDFRTEIAQPISERAAEANSGARRERSAIPRKTSARRIRTLGTSAVYDQAKLPKAAILPSA